MVQGQPGQKVNETPSQQIKAAMVVQGIPRYRGSINRTIVVQTSPVIKLDPYSKIIRAKRAGGEAEVVECLPSKP
jgi:hypothetical protein